MDYYYENTKFNRKALSQVYGIMCDYDEEDLEKLPLKFRKFVEANRDKEYDFTIYDVEEDNSNLLEETKQILAYIYTNFLGTPEEKEVLKKLEDIQYEKSKKNYEINFYEKKEQAIEETLENTKQEKQLTEYKESFFTKILNSIKRFFSFRK